MEKTPALLDRVGDLPEPDLTPDSSLEEMRRILLHGQVEKIEGLETGLGQLEHRMHDEDALVRMITPVLGIAIRLKISEARDEMIEALYPIIGKVVQRAVAESVRDLARSLDAQVKSSFDLRLTWWRIRARLNGASEAQIRLRELLPFTVTDILLIHRETGLLLYHLPSEISKTSDTDLLSGMLTAIRDFSHETLGGDGHAGLGEITYGDQSILIEATQHADLAMIINGIAPPEFRTRMRECIIEVEHSYADELRTYQGDAGFFVPVKNILGSLMATASPRGLSTTQKRFLAGALVTLSILLVGCGLLVNWAWQLAHRTPAPLVVVVQPSPASTVTPSATALSTSTATLQPTATQVFTLLPPTPMIGVIVGNVWIHIEPSSGSTRLGQVLTVGEQVELLALDGEWARVRKLVSGQDDVTGWIPIRWLGITTLIPDQLITPSAVP